ncbi:ribosomal-protein-alanine N-acetyltransferase [Desulfonatronum thiosulfatophilum]|uniref:[Ribosomal protein bS18]-alanine N-acetyltransferase n=1 Tax=Desulfonatronum thiosulfatophilum TaxID=617002 RepID=A0A1G6CM20_9BACT|nr:ribosomal protein S18-alanine N-acetyltransferase [Desulfonatronum thiosulfatophilum]SDB33795.1 ribosomal-protein-alanine N-acetyltransferase [Desulfonatronum thiosulfatophilum]
MQVARLTHEDLSEVAELEALCFAAPWSLQQIRSGFDSESSCIFGVRKSGVLVGYISLVVLPPEMEILNIAVHPDHRRRGLGKALVGAALEHARAENVENCLLDVDEANTAALGLYEFFDFCRTGRRRAYYRFPSGARDAILMRCSP